MGTIKDLADQAFRDMEAPGSSVANEPDKAEIRATFDEVDRLVEDFSDVVLAGRLGFETWAAMSAASAPAANTLGSVEPSDTGTHTDPVVGGTVANSGMYRYSTSPAGWKRIGPYRAVEVATQSEANAGTDGAKAITPATLAGLTSDNYETILLAFVPGSGTASSTYTVRVVNPFQKLNPALAGQITKWQAPFNCNGNHNVIMQNYDGTTVLGLTFCSAPDGTQEAINGFLKYDWLEVVRNPDPIGDNPGTANQLRRIAAPNPAAIKAPAFAQHIDTGFGLPLGVGRPVSFRQSGTNTSIVGIRWDDVDSYENSAARHHSDRTMVTLIDMKDFQVNVPDGVVALNSYGARVADIDHTLTNLQFTVLDGDETEEGNMPSTFEPPFFMGPFSGSAANMLPRGIGHGHMENSTCSIVGTEDAVGVELYGSPPLTEWCGDSLHVSITAFITDNSDQIGGYVEYDLDCEQDPDWDFRVRAFYDFGVSALEIVPGTTGAGAYCMTVPLMGFNRIVGFFNGVRVTGVGSSVNGIHVIDLRDTTITNIGLVDTVIAWHTDYPEVQFTVTNLIGQGKSCRINGVAQTAVNTSGVQNNEWGPKLIGIPVYNLGSSKHDLTGETYEFDYGGKLKRDGVPIT